jgi:hypothetical protein
MFREFLYVAIAGYWVLQSLTACEARQQANSNTGLLGDIDQKADSQSYVSQELNDGDNESKLKEVKPSDVALTSEDIQPLSNPAANSQVAKKALAMKNGREGYLITSGLPRNYVRDGSIDYTWYLQKAINENANLIFPPFPILVNDNGLTIPSNRTLKFLSGSVLVLKPSTKKKYNIINLSNVSNVSMIDPVIRGDRYSHLDDVGEHGMGIAIRGGKNISIYNANISECWGDGIYIGQGLKQAAAQNVVIKNSYLKKNRRDGISIISVNGLLLENVYAGYSDGTKPMCGINFESNNPMCEMKNIVVLNCRTEFNQGNGLQFGLSTMLGGMAKEVDIKVVNHQDRGSQSYAFKISCRRKPGSLGGDIKGKINIINPSWHMLNRPTPFTFLSDQPALNVTLIDPVIKLKERNLAEKEISLVLSKYTRGNFSYSSN